MGTNRSRSASAEPGFRASTPRLPASEPSIPGVIRYTWLPPLTWVLKVAERAFREISIPKARKHPQTRHPVHHEHQRNPLHLARIRLLGSKGRGRALGGISIPERAELPFKRRLSCTTIDSLLKEACVTTDKPFKRTTSWQTATLHNLRCYFPASWQKFPAPRRREFTAKSLKLLRPWRRNFQKTPFRPRYSL